MDFRIVLRIEEKPRVMRSISSRVSLAGSRGSKLSRAVRLASGPLIERTTEPGTHSVSQMADYVSCDNPVKRAAFRHLHDKTQKGWPVLNSKGPAHMERGQYCFLKEERIANREQMGYIAASVDSAGRVKGPSLSMPRIPAIRSVI